jgi:DNA-binding MarR family transcriptional regulator
MSSLRATSRGDAGAPDIEFRVMAGLVRALDWFDNSLQNVLASRGFRPLHRTQSLIMIHVAGGIGSPSAIAREMGLSRQNVHHMAKSLIAEGLIEQAPDPADPRRSLYRLAGAASEIRGAALQTLAQLEQVLAGRIGSRSLDALRGALGKDWGAEIDGREALTAELDGRKT